MKAKIAYLGSKEGQDTYLTFNGEYAEHDNGVLIALKFPSGTKIIPASRVISIWIPTPSKDDEGFDAPPPPIA